MTGQRFWNSGADLWPLFGPPLRPGDEDGAILEDLLLDWSRRHGTPQMLVLGVTPEVHALAQRHGWPLQAVDRVSDMFDSVWPGDPADTLCADWKDIPLEPASRDVVVLDGGLQMLAYPQEQARLAQEMRRILRPDGLFIGRMFALPAVAESAEAVIADLRRGEIPRVDALKLRLGMALQRSPEAGAALRQVWETVRAAEPDFEALARRLGWPIEQMQSLHAYEHATESYHFFDVDALCSVWCGQVGGFERAAVKVGSYPLAERCPTVALRRLRE